MDIGPAAVCRFQKGVRQTPGRAPLTSLSCFPPRRPTIPRRASEKPCDATAPLFQVHSCFVRRQVALKCQGWDKGPSRQGKRPVPKKKTIRPRREGTRTTRSPSPGNVALNLHTATSQSEPSQSSCDKVSRCRITRSLKERLMPQEGALNQRL